MKEEIALGRVLMIVDWGSLSYHLLHGTAGRKETSYIKMYDKEDELHVWRNAMFRKMMGLVKEINPIDIVIACDGSDVWRHDIVKEYYGKYTLVAIHKETSAYYVRYDNKLFKIYKDSDGDIIYAQLKVQSCKDITNELSLIWKPVSEYPSRVYDMIYSNGVVPKYKGTRSSREWNFYIDKKEFQLYKDKFSFELSKLFRSTSIHIDRLEADDIISVTCQEKSKDYDYIVVVTADSDMNQLLKIPNVRIYNHKSDEFITCVDPELYITAKILSGDASDNINGIVLLDKKQSSCIPLIETDQGIQNLTIDNIPLKSMQLGESGAYKLLNVIYESGDTIDTKANKEGWANQLERNRQLIDLFKIPSKYYSQISECIMFNTELVSLDEATFQITDKLQDEYNLIKNMGCYVVMDRDYVYNEMPTYKYKKDNSKIEYKVSINVDNISTLPSMDDIFGDMI